MPVRLPDAIFNSPQLKIDRFGDGLGGFKSQGWLDVARHDGGSRFRCAAGQFLPNNPLTHCPSSF